MTDQFPREPRPDATQGDEVDITARLAGIGERRPSLSIYTRRPGSLPPAPSPTGPSTADEDHVAEPATPPAPDPAAASTASIGQLTRVPAARLWADGAALATWLSAAPRGLLDVIGVPAAAFDPTDGAIALGTAEDGTPLCVVCEVGPSTDECLGVLLRVAAVQEGGTVVWLTGEPSDTHIAALSWLNRSTTPRFSLVRVTGVQIDGSASAPMFDRVVRPPRGADTGAGVASPAAAPRRRVDDHLPEG